MIKKLLLIPVLFLIFINANAQCSECALLPNAVPGITLTHQNTNCFNNSGVAYNPIFNVYYGVRAGNPVFPLETWTSAGVPLYNTTAGFDWRGMWWNPVTNQLEGNGYSTYGMWRADLNGSGWALNTGVNIFNGMNQPDPQSCGDLDWQAYEVLYYFNGLIYRYSRSTNAFLGSYAITGTPGSINNLNSTTLMYTGCSGMEIALLDYVNNAVYVYNKATGAYAGTSLLPVTAVTTNSFRTSYSNGYVWLFNLNDVTWYSYKILTGQSSSITATVSLLNNVACNGGNDGSVVVSASGGTPGYTYLWNSSPVQTTDTAVGLPAGTYTVTVTDSTGCTKTATATVTEPVVLTTSLTGQKNETCSGAADGSVTVIASGGDSLYSYSWNTIPVQTVDTAKGLSAGSYTVTVTDGKGCTSTAGVTITTHPLPAVNAGSDTTICSNASALLNVSGPSQGSTYSWSPTTGLSCINCPDPAATPSVTTSYIVSVTDSAGCSAQDTVVVNVTQNSAIVSPADTLVCSGSTLQLNAGGGTTFEWKPATGLTDTTSANPFAIPTAAITYTVTVTSGNCTATATATINLYPVMPTPKIKQSFDTLSCSTDPSYIYFQWYFDSNLIPNATKSFYLATQNGNYNVAVTDTNGCQIAVGINAVVNGIQIPPGSGLPGNSIYFSPNPAHDKLVFHINSTGLSKVFTISILNTLGELIKTETINLEKESDVLIKDITAGVYFLHINSENGSVVKRFVKD